MKKIFCLGCLIFLLSACSLNQSTKYEIIDDPEFNQASAQLALTNFLGLLNQKQYEQASYYYGGSYDLLKKLNPKVSSSSQLLEFYCQKNNGQCLIPDIFNSEQLSEDQWRFTVEFYNDQGELYIVPGCPCHGGGKSKFKFTVIKKGEQFLVQDLPPKE